MEFVKRFLRFDKMEVSGGFKINIVVGAVTVTAPTILGVVQLTDKSKFEFQKI